MMGVVARLRTIDAASRDHEPDLQIGNRACESNMLHERLMRERAIELILGIVTIENSHRRRAFRCADTCVVGV